MLNDKTTQILGHEKNISFLKKILELNSKGSAVTTSSYVLTGPTGVGKKTVLYWFLQTLLCQQPSPDWQPCNKCSGCQQLQYGSWPDLHIVKRLEGKKGITQQVKKSQIEDLIRRLSMSSFLDGYKVGIIYEAERLNASSANILLKQLEEPNAKVLIFLLVNDLQDLLPTIVSRSQVLHFKPVKTDIIYDHLADEHKVKRSQARNIAQLSAGRPGLALAYLKNPDFYNEQVKLAEIFVNSFANDINWRLEAIADLLNKTSGQEAVDKALSIIDVWQKVARDLIIYKQGENDLILHQVLADELAKVSQRQPLERLKQAISSLGQARQYIQANVGPKLALEQIMINL